METASFRIWHDVPSPNPKHPPHYLNPWTLCPYKTLVDSNFQLCISRHDRICVEKLQAVQKGAQSSCEFSLQGISEPLWSHGATMPKGKKNGCLFFWCLVILNDHTSAVLLRANVAHENFFELNLHEYSLYKERLIKLVDAKHRWTVPCRESHQSSHQKC